ncbi:MAG: hypothetical protein BGO51_23385 [Rhodospirillales bacterium 69-11]|nr:hypothetical protein [Rhodospirillales bacterium]OJW22759.1 MAG: hypothetical protein BGO51_23385 [Rhodospirillales bacterium 69-11]
MSRMENLASPPLDGFCGISLSQDLSQAVMLVDSRGTSATALANLCGFLEIGLLRADDDLPLAAQLERHRPMAIVAELDDPMQDGCHVLMTVAGFDPDLPVLLVTGDDPRLLGAVDAVEELWGLGRVTRTPALPPAGALVEFLFQAGRRAGVGRMMPV